MAEMTYHEWAASPGVIPSYIAGTWGTRWQQALGLLGSALRDGAYYALTTRWITTCPDDALAYHGAALGWPQAPGETADEYRARLAYSWKLAEWRGTTYGMKLAFEALGMPNLDVYEAWTPGWGRYAGDATKGRWAFLVLRHPHPFGSDFGGRYGSGHTYGDGLLYGTSGSTRLVELVRRMVRTMKPAHCHVEYLAIVLSGDIKHAGLSDDGDAEPGSAVAYLPID